MTVRPIDIRSAASAGADPRDFWILLKPRVMSLVVFTGAVGLALAPRGDIHPVQAIIAILCIAVGSGASGAINMWYERDIDAKMRRTRDRPLPAGRMTPGEALGFGVTLAVASVLVMGIALNIVAGLLLAAAICFYVFVYTIGLKRRTPQNIVIGGAAGAFPPMIGWAAATGDVSWASIVLFALIFFWTPPHFWSLSLYRTDDYAAAGIPMLPVVAGARATRIQILAYTLVLWSISLAPTLIGTVGWVYGTAAIALNLGFTALALRLLAARDEASARAMFRFSLLYLFLLFAFLIVDRAVA
ncbi:MAG TPA: heme o synthase [Stellaceae bacterium]|jgi:protoheme IX farnesyltransferase